MFSRRLRDDSVKLSGVSARFLAWRRGSTKLSSLRVSPVQPAPLELKLKRRGLDDLGYFLRRAIPSTLLRRHRPFRVRPAELPGLEDTFMPALLCTSLEVPNTGACASKPPAPAVILGTAPPFASLYAPVSSIHLAVGRTQELDKAILLVPPRLHYTPTPCSPAPASLTSTCRRIYVITHLGGACRFSCQVHDALPTLLRPPSYGMPISALLFPSPSTPPPPPRVVFTTSAARPRPDADFGASRLSLTVRRSVLEPLDPTRGSTPATARRMHQRSKGSGGEDSGGEEEEVRTLDAPYDISVPRGGRSCARAVLASRVWRWDDTVAGRAKETRRTHVVSWGPRWAV
ncbi:hypothetical protein B0H14DRAFT_3484785 [Mycena olivaceomarginata]|nr:hypothetical protein B0H14DRAFT_3484785 [Mycena olivaceomarginata]